MDLSRQSGRPMRFDEYLAFEEQSPMRHEYVAGEVYAMTGGTTRHNIITLNIAAYLRGPARARGCRVFASDVKVQVADRIYYPDVILACGRAGEVEQIVEAPTLVVEVTSPSTRATDRREKLETYRGIQSLQVYLIVEQRRRHVLVYVRDADGAWSREEVVGDGGVFIPPLDLRVGLDEIYEGLELPPLAVGEHGDWDYGDDAVEEF